jgi:hypothetical protein
MDNFAVACVTPCCKSSSCQPSYLGNVAVYDDIDTQIRETANQILGPVSQDSYRFGNVQQ